MVATLSLCAISAPATAIENGSFEVPQQADPTRVPIGELADWFAADGYMLLEQGPNYASFMEAHTGTQFVSFGHSGDSGGTLWQPFPTTPRQLSRVSFHVRCIQGDGDQELLAEVLDADGAVLASIVASVDRFDKGWVPFTLTFEAASDSSEMRFRHTLGSDFANIALDSVSLSAAGCNAADLAEPFDLLDLADLNTFVAGFVDQDPIADLTGDTFFDLHDINTFVTAFLSGCP
jgi:hypothetical protein